VKKSKGKKKTTDNENYLLLGALAEKQPLFCGDARPACVRTQGQVHDADPSVFRRGRDGGPRWSFFFSFLFAAAISPQHDTSERG